MKRLFSIVVCLAIISLVAFGASDFEKALENAKNYYNQGEFNKAIEELQKAMSSLEKQKDEDMIEAYKYLGFSYVAFGEKEKAKAEFKKVIKLDPQLQLDPSFVSPKIIAVFEEARAELQAEGFDFSKKPVYINPQPEPPKPQGQWTRGGAFARSLFVPGLGQIYKGQKVKGYVILGAETLFLLATLNAMGEYNDAKSAYEDAKYGEDFEALYSDYESASGKANGMAAVLGILWTYNIIDASFFGQSNTTLYPSMNYGSPGLKLQIKF
ncbi:MAG: tetratricopeptide repeat protein [bacterium]|nr:tetratricopeptide repeat protein [bacterium]